MYIGIAQIIQIVVCIAAFVTIIKWIQSQRCCECCRFSYETHVRHDGSIDTVGTASENISSFSDVDIDAWTYIEYEDGKYYLWTWFELYMSYEQGLCREIKRCPICGRKLK